MSSGKRFSVVLFITAFLHSASAVSELAEDSVLVSSNNTLYEYTPQGALLSQLPIPANSLSEVARDIVVLEDGRLAVFNGTFAPELSIYNGSSWESVSVDGWSVPNNLSYGGLAVRGDRVFLTDGFTYNGGEPQGLVIVNLAELSSQRFFEADAYIDITLGGDQLLYALKNTYGDLNVIDPNSMEVVRSIDLGHTSSSRGVAASADGSIYMVSWNGYVARYDAEGGLLNSLQIGGNLHDIDIDGTGRIIVGSRFGRVYLTDEALSSFHEIVASNTNAFVAFSTPGTSPKDFAPPVLEASQRKRGRNIETTLTWSTEAEAVDVYFNGQLIDGQLAGSTATYAYFKKISQVFLVCNTGTQACSEEYIAN